MQPKPLNPLTPFPRGCTSLALIALCTLFAGSVQAQQPASALPANAPTTPPAQPASSVTYGVPADHPPTVTYTDGQLTVAANDSSLNQILRAISHAINLKITGGVADERVFGTYGPGTPSKVLAELLDGTASNVLIIQDRNRQATAGNAPPLELVLTTRNGGPTPPNPNPQPFDNGPRRESQPTPPQPSYPIAAPTPPPGVSNPNPGSTAAGLAGTSAPSSSDTTQQQSPNGVRTPQQIYDQLQQLRQLQQQQQTPQQR